MSNSEAAWDTDGFRLLDIRLQRWLHRQGWESLSNAQNEAIRTVLKSDSDVLISAATAAGKTEAAFLPVLTALATDKHGHVSPIDSDDIDRFDPWKADSPKPLSSAQVLVVSPLKALINDQHMRLRSMADMIGVNVTPWHGDISASVKKRFLENPSGVLLITPESLEAMLMLRGSQVPAMFADLRFVVVDELHAFLDSQRGVQLQSLLHRVNVAAGVTARRIGLSATLADMSVAQSFLNSANPDNVHMVVGPRGREMFLQVRGYLDSPDTYEPDENEDYEWLNADSDIAEHLYQVMRGNDNLVFVNARASAELYSGKLTQLCEDNGVPNEFAAHHSSLSRAERQETEDRLRGPTPTTAVCTSSLELGIDIGSVYSIAQIGPPPLVSGLLQRLGRSGRRDQSARLRVYVTETDLTSDSDIIDALRIRTAKTAAMLQLMFSGWLENNSHDGLNYSTMMQQVMSVIVQHNGMNAVSLYRLLSGSGAFADVTPDRFHRLLSDMHAAELIEQEASGIMLLGEKGERETGSYEFYSTFEVDTEWTVREMTGAGGERVLGTLPSASGLHEGDKIIFAGRRWLVVQVDKFRRDASVRPEKSRGFPPAFATGFSAMADDRVVQEMAHVYESHDLPPWLDEQASNSLTTGRAMYNMMHLGDEPWLLEEDLLTVFPWRGDVILRTMCSLLRRRDMQCWVEGHVLRLPETDNRQMRKHVAAILEGDVPDPTDLADDAPGAEVGVWGEYLGGVLTAEAIARRYVDVPNAIEAFGHLQETL